MKFPAPAVTRLAVALALSLATPLVAARGVPAGFEDLVEGQTEQLEVRLFGRSTGLVPVRVTLEHVQLEAPGAAGIAAARRGTGRVVASAVAAAAAQQPSGLPLRWRQRRLRLHRSPRGAHRRARAV